MSLRWQEYDPYTGVTEINVADEDGDDVRVHRVQDVDPLLSLTAEARATKAADAGKTGENLRKYCSIPVVVQYELLKKGINVFNPDHMPRVIAEIEANYPRLKYTDKKHSLTPKPIVKASGEPLISPKPEISTGPGPFVIVR